MTPPRLNPFRVDRVSALPFVGADVAALADAFVRLGRAAIVGPHGAGKSTLLRAVGDELVSRGVTVTPVTLPASATPAERRAAVRQAASARGVVLLDGYEQFRWPDRRRLRRVPGMLATAHGPAGLPTLVTLKPTTDTIDAIVRLVLPGASADTVARSRVAFSQCRGDVRETLMALYDERTVG